MMNHVYIGYDPREDEAYRVARYSIESRTEEPVLITPLHLNLVHRMIPQPVMKKEQMWCLESDAPQSTEFARSRFAIPKFHSNGWVVFMDCDMIVRADIADLFALADCRYAVQVVKHEHGSGPDLKMDSQMQTYYNRKNWSSVVLWNCAHEGHIRLTDIRMNCWPGRDLHAFKWLNDDEIGELPKEWNHLVGVNPPEEARDAKILHYTLGGPWFGEEYDTGDFASREWMRERYLFRKHLYI